MLPMRGRVVEASCQVLFLVGWEEREGVARSREAGQSEGGETEVEKEAEVEEDSSPMMTLATVKESSRAKLG